MDAEQAGMAEPGDVDEPEEEGPEYWEDDELTPEEMAGWFGRANDGEAARAAGEWSVVDAAGPALRAQGEGSVPDLVAAVLAASGDPALMSDADLVRSLAAWHGVASRAEGRELRATVELLRRRRPRAWDRRADRTGNARQEPWGAGPGVLEGAPGRAAPAVAASREAAAEIALALTATGYAAHAQAELAACLSRRLPAAFGELDAGRADLYRVRLLAEATQFLSDEDAGKVDALLGPCLGQMTTGDLRDKARKAVIGIDGAAADRRRERAERRARFALYGNDDATATAAVERMPAHLGAAVKARVNAIARAARAAGMTGPMPLIEARVATGLLLGTLPGIPPPADGDSRPCGPAPAGPHGPGPAGDPWDGGWPAGVAPDASGDAGADAPDGGGPSEPVPDFADDRYGSGLEDAAPENVTPEDPGLGAMAWPAIPAQAGAAAPGCLGVPSWLRPKDPGRIRLTVPWRSLAGMGAEPGELSWIGPVTPAQARELAAAAAAGAGCSWQLIVTDEHGHAIAITALGVRRGPRAGPAGLVGTVTITISQALAAALGRDGQPSGQMARALDRLDLAGTELAGLLAAAIPAANAAAAPAARTAAARTAADLGAGGCTHTMQAPGYRVPGRLRCWLNARDRTCRNPICRQPAIRCDQDHTIAWHRGGRTCPCNLGGLCRAHHELKQLPGWQLTQDQHGYFTWRTPAGLAYRKEPHRYAI